MRIYAAISSSEGYYDVLRTVGYPHVLISFWYDQDRRVLDRMGYRPESMVSDSGAFSAWQAGAKVDLDAYAAWCHDWRAHPDRPPCDHVNLDVIAGSKHQPANDRELAQAVAAGMLNADRLRGEGLPVGEVYHQFEPLDVLDRLLQRQQPGEVLNVATNKAGSLKGRTRFLDGVWHHLLRVHRLPLDRLPRIHGLGISNKELIWRYPWWSVDTLAWVAPGMYGRGVNREGRSTLNTGRVDSREASVALRRYRCAEVLRLWERWNRQLDKLWADRGVTWQTPAAV